MLRGVGEIVEAGDLVPGVQQFQRGVAADVAGDAGD
jgi:hypothetical protein